MSAALWELGRDRQTQSDLALEPSEVGGLTLLQRCSSLYGKALVVQSLAKSTDDRYPAGGVLLAGFVNPVAFLFLGPRLAPYLDSNKPLTFGHTLSDQLGGQLAAGFILERMFEDTRPASDCDPLSEYISGFVATRAVPPR